MSAEGVSIWLDDLSRRRIDSGNLAGLVENKHVVGVTTNPSIFQAAIGSGDGYEEQLADLAVRGVTVEEAVRMMTTADVRAAADVLRPVYEATGGRDGRVSIEVDPRLAHATTATVAEARQLAWLVDRPNVMIKIPATRAGLPAITEVVGAGISVNVTLIFSLERYREVMDAYLAGLEKARAAGRGPVADPLGGLVLRLPGRLRDRQAADRAGHRGGAGAQRAGRPWPTRGSPTRRTSRCSARRTVRRRPVSASPRSRAPGPTRSVRCGRPPG
ncbi:transaldolase [Streptomyces sp. e14]|nr:transaldolase [Streptomyces sp. e14]